MNSFKTSCRSCRADITMGQDPETRKWHPYEGDETVKRHVCDPSVRSEHSARRRIGYTFETTCQECGERILMKRITRRGWIACELDKKPHDCPALAAKERDRIVDEEEKALFDEMIGATTFEQFQSASIRLASKRAAPA